ncbi:MAG: choice-of-anchor B family protein [Pyrinomonadaceae bacterium]
MKTNLMFLATSSNRRTCLLLILITLGLFLIFRAEAHEGEVHGGGPNGQPDNAPMSAMSTTPCVNGMAGTFPCRNIDLVSFLPLSSIGGLGGTENANDIWGWTDPQTGKEYAIIGLASGTSFIDISSPANPVYLGKLPAHSVNSLWRGIKVYKNHAFIVSEAANHGMRVFDLTQLRNVTNPPVTFTETAHYNNFGRAHTLALNEQSGFAYAAGSQAGANICGRSLHIVDVRNPAAPTFAGCVLPIAPDGYTHETQCVTYSGPDAAYQGREICFNSNNASSGSGPGAVTIVDVTNKSNPVQLSRTTYPGVGYTHQGWLTEDQKHFLIDDEFDEFQQHINSTTHIMDVSDLDAPTAKAPYVGSSTAIDHNLYIRGNYAYEGNYRSGLRILNIINVSTSNFVEDAFFDIYPLDDAPAFNGAWSNYPFFQSGVVIVGGIEQGLFVLRPTSLFAPVGLSSDQVDIQTWKQSDGKTYAKVKLTFPDSGYRVQDQSWGQPSSSGNNFTVDSVVERSNGASIQTPVTAVHIYDLGLLAPGNYNFTFRTLGASTKTQNFTVSDQPPPANQIDDQSFFVAQHYRDFLGREPDAPGLNFWTDNITKCNDPARRPAGQTVAQCIERQRETTSAAFFLSPEFQYTGYYLYRLYKGGLGRVAYLSEFTSDRAVVSNGIVVSNQLSGAVINQNKRTLAEQFVQRPEFVTRYGALSNQQYVDKLFETTGINPSPADRQALVDGLNGLNNLSETRATVLFKVVDGIHVISEGNQQFTTSYGEAFYNQQLNPAFVHMQYFGYMQRDPDAPGYAFWLQKLTTFGNYLDAQMVLAFIVSPEYRARFGAP